MPIPIPFLNKMREKKLDHSTQSSGSGSSKNPSPTPDNPAQTLPGSFQDQPSSPMTFQGQPSNPMTWNPPQNSPAQTPPGSNPRTDVAGAAPPAAKPALTVPPIPGLGATKFEGQDQSSHFVRSDLFGSGSGETIAKDGKITNYGSMTYDTKTGNIGGTKIKPVVSPPIAPPPAAKPADTTAPPTKTASSDSAGPPQKSREYPTGSGGKMAANEDGTVTMHQTDGSWIKYGDNGKVLDQGGPGSYRIGAQPVVKLGGPTGPSGSPVPGGPPEKVVTGAQVGGGYNAAGHPSSTTQSWPTGSVPGGVPPGTHVTPDPQQPAGGSQGGGQTTTRPPAVVVGGSVGGSTGGQVGHAYVIKSGPVEHTSANLIKTITDAKTGATQRIFTDGYSTLTGKGGKIVDTSHLSQDQVDHTISSGSLSKEFIATANKAETAGILTKDAHSVGSSIAAATKDVIPKPPGMVTITTTYSGAKIGQVAGHTPYIMQKAPATDVTSPSSYFQDHSTADRPTSGAPPKVTPKPFGSARTPDRGLANPAAAPAPHGMFSSIEAAAKAVTAASSMPKTAANDTAHFPARPVSPSTSPGSRLAANDTAHFPSPNVKYAEPVAFSTPRNAANDAAHFPPLNSKTPVTTGFGNAPPPFPETSYFPTMPSSVPGAPSGNLPPAISQTPTSTPSGIATPAWHTGLGWTTPDKDDKPVIAGIHPDDILERQSENNGRETLRLSNGTYISVDPQHPEQTPQYAGHWNKDEWTASGFSNSPSPGFTWTTHNGQTGWWSQADLNDKSSDMATKTNVTISGNAAVQAHHAAAMGDDGPAAVVPTPPASINPTPIPTTAVAKPDLDSDVVNAGNPDQAIAIGTGAAPSTTPGSLTAPATPLADASTYHSYDAFVKPGSATTPASAAPAETVTTPKIHQPPKALDQHGDSIYSHKGALTTPPASLAFQPTMGSSVPGPAPPVSPPAYTGGAKVVKAEYPYPGATITTTASGAKVEQAEWYTPYTAQKAPSKSGASYFQDHATADRPASSPAFTAPTMPSSTPGAPGSMASALPASTPASTINTDISKSPSVQAHHAAALGDDAPPIATGSGAAPATTPPPINPTPTPITAVPKPDLDTDVINASNPDRAIATGPATPPAPVTAATAPTGGASTYHSYDAFAHPSAPAPISKIPLPDDLGNASLDDVEPLATAPTGGASTYHSYDAFVKPASATTPASGASTTETGATPKNLQPPKPPDQPEEGSIFAHPDTLTPPAVATQVEQGYAALAKAPSSAPATDKYKELPNAWPPPPAPKIASNDTAHFPSSNIKYAAPAAATPPPPSYFQDHPTADRSTPIPKPGDKISPSKPVATPAPPNMKSPPGLAAAPKPAPKPIASVAPPKPAPKPIAVSAPKPPAPKPAAVAPKPAPKPIASVAPPKPAPKPIAVSAPKPPAPKPAATAAPQPKPKPQVIASVAPPKPSIVQFAPNAFNPTPNKSAAFTKPISGGTNAKPASGKKK